MVVNAYDEQDAIALFDAFVNKTYQAIHSSFQASFPNDASLSTSSGKAVMASFDVLSKATTFLSASVAYHNAPDGQKTIESVKVYHDTAISTILGSLGAFAVVGGSATAFAVVAPKADIVVILKRTTILFILIPIIAGGFKR